MNFIKFTRLNGNQIIINVNNITSMESIHDGTFIIFDQKCDKVKETLEEIIIKINDLGGELQ